MFVVRKNLKQAFFCALCAFLCSAARIHGMVFIFSPEYKQLCSFITQVQSSGANPSYEHIFSQDVMCFLERMRLYQIIDHQEKHKRSLINQTIDLHPFVSPSIQEQFQKTQDFIFSLRNKCYLLGLQSLFFKEQIQRRFRPSRLSDPALLKIANEIAQDALKAMDSFAHAFPQCPRKEIDAFIQKFNTCAIVFSDLSHENITAGNFFFSIHIDPCIIAQAEADKIDLLYSTVCHEVAHGWLGQKLLSGNETPPQFEFDADTLTLLTLNKLGLSSAIIRYMLEYLAPVNTNSELSQGYIFGRINGLALLPEKQKNTILKILRSDKCLRPEKHDLATLIEHWRPVKTLAEALKQAEFIRQHHSTSNRMEQ